MSAKHRRAKQRELIQQYRRNERAYRRLDALAAKFSAQIREYTKGFKEITTASPRGTGLSIDPVIALNKDYGLCESRRLCFTILKVREPPVIVPVRARPVDIDFFNFSKRPKE